MLLLVVLVLLLVTMLGSSPAVPWLLVAVGESLTPAAASGSSRWWTCMEVVAIIAGRPGTTHVLPSYARSCTACKCCCQVWRHIAPRGLGHGLAGRGGWVAAIASDVLRDVQGDAAVHWAAGGRLQAAKER